MNIPEGWVTRPLNDLVDFLDSQRRPIKSADRAAMRGQYPYYGASGIIDWVNDYLFDEEIILLGEDGENILSRSLPLAFMVSGKVWVNNHAHVFRPKRGAVDIRFLTELLEFQDYADLNSGTAQPKINKASCKALELTFPEDIREQEAIAEALSDADALIEGLERLIAKKRLIKQGAMQDLLTAKRRLPGFSGEWVETAIQDFAIIDPETLGAGTPNDRIIKYISLEDVNCGALNGWTEMTFAEAPSRARRVLRNNDVLLGTVRPNLQSHHLFTQHGDDWIGSTGFAVLRVRPELCSARYLFELIMSNVIGRQIDELIAGSNYPAISNGDVRKLKVSLPSPDEQEAISEILGDMDAEIQALETRLEKARQVKEGMMQNLLTGRIRLV